MHQVRSPLHVHAGNGCVNDFSRGFATHSLATYLAGKLGVSAAAVKQRVAMIMSGGCEGALSPHLLVYCIDEAAAQVHQAKLCEHGVIMSDRHRPQQCTLLYYMCCALPQRGLRLDRCKIPAGMFPKEVS